MSNYALQSQLNSLEAELRRVQEINRQLRFELATITDGVSRANDELTNYNQKIRNSLDYCNSTMARSHTRVVDAIALQAEIDEMFWGDDPEKVDYGALYSGRYPILKKAAARFWQNPDKEFDAFCEENAFWLDDYALFMALKKNLGGAPWYSWDAPIRNREAAALEAVKEPCEVLLTTDSKYVCDSITKGWVYSWQKNGWRKADKKPALNVDLWETLLPLLEKHKVTFMWVKGHNEHPENERCDKLAVSEYQRYI